MGKRDGLSASQIPLTYIPYLIRGGSALTFYGPCNGCTQADLSYPPISPIVPSTGPPQFQGTNSLSSRFILCQHVNELPPHLSNQYPIADYSFNKRKIDHNQELATVFQYKVTYLQTEKVLRQPRRRSREISSPLHPLDATEDATENANRASLPR